MFRRYFTLPCMRLYLLLIAASLLFSVMAFFYLSNTSFPEHPHHVEVRIITKIVYVKDTYNQPETATLDGRQENDQDRETPPSFVTAVPSTPSRPELPPTSEYSTRPTTTPTPSGSTGDCIISEAARNWSNECRVPELNPFDDVIVKFIHPHHSLTCPGRRFMELKNGSLAVLESAKDAKLLSVSYKPIVRKPHSDWGFELKEEKTLQPDQQPFKINDEFIEVRITSEKGEHVEYHAQVVPSPGRSSPGPTPGGLPLSVVIVGFDSVSYAQFQRAFPDAYHYMKDELKSVFMRGNTIVGDGTTPALAALLTGKFEADLPEARRGYRETESVDRWPWIFKDFKAKGYATLYSEDGPAYGAFNYRLHGFTEPPTDHYSRYFWQAAKKTSAYCIRSQPQYAVHFDYVETFFEAYKGKPKFGLAFLSEISHNSLDSVYVAARDFHGLLKRLRSGNLLNNTMLVVMSDHGFRFGEARSTLQGKLEERLPFLSLTLPPWFHKQFPHLVKNLEHNADRLVTPFDLHATFRHILSYPELPQSSKWGTTLFDVIPASRDCSTAGVAEHYCPCVRWQPVDRDHWSIKQSAQAAVAHINNMTSSDADGAKLCARLELAEVMSAYQKIPNLRMQQHLGSADVHGRVAKFADKLVPIVDCMYQLELRTVPGDAHFEVAVTNIKGVFRVSGEPSRVNLYGDQPKCIVDKRPDLRKYCFCRYP